MTTPTDYDPLRLFNPTFIPTETTVFYTAPNIDAVQLTSVKLVNALAAAVTVSLFIVSHSRS